MSAPAPAAAASPSPSSSGAAPDGVLSRFSYLGFDLDHTLVRYRLEEFAQFMYDMLRSYVVEHTGYPRRILEVPFSFESQHKGLVFDAHLGHFLKLSAEKKILAAAHGYPQRMLTRAEIERDYGANAVIAEFDGSRHERWHPFYTYFEMPAQLLVAQMVQATDDGLVHIPAAGALTPSQASSPTPARPYAHLFPSLGAAFEYHLGASDRGDYFPEFEKDPGRFLRKREEVKAWLQGLRAQGKFLFLATNSRLDYTRLLARYSFGEDWESLFDLIIADAKKPGWFMRDGEKLPTGKHTPRPFYHPNAQLVADLTRPPVTDQELRTKHRTVIHGNAPALQKMFEAMEQEKGNTTTPPTVIYFGDHLHTDCIATRAYTDWSAGAIVEEVEEHHDDSSDPAGGADGARVKPQTFSELPERAKKKRPHPEAVFGSFFHHLPEVHRSPPAEGNDMSDSNGSTVASAVAPSASPDDPFTAPVESDWSYWHSILSRHCEVVVGCLSDFTQKEAVDALKADDGRMEDVAASSTNASQRAPLIPGVGPKLNSTCVVAPTIVRFQPPPFSAAAAAGSSTPPVTLQYSIHRVPPGMRQELRPIFPELSNLSSNRDATSSSSSELQPLSSSAFKSLPLLAIPTFQQSSLDLCAISADTAREKDRLLESVSGGDRECCAGSSEDALWMQAD
jgi:HAD superfamily 5'-nucleotidase-like hydrolase